MESKVLSTGVRRSSLRQSYIRPASERPVMGMDLVDIEEVVMQNFNSLPSHPSYHIHWRLHLMMNLMSSGHLHRSSVLNMIRYLDTPEPAADDDDDDDVNNAIPPLVNPGALITMPMAQLAEAEHFISISTDNHHDDMQSREDLQSHTRSWHHRLTRYVRFSSNSLSFKSVGDGEEETRRASNPRVSEELQKNGGLRKMVLSLSVSITPGLIGIKNSSVSSNPIIVRLIALALCVGYAATLNSIFIRKLNISWTPRVVDSIEQVGIVLLLGAFFATLGLLFPSNLSWVSYLCFTFSLLPFLMRFFKLL